MKFNDEFLPEPDCLYDWELTFEGGSTRTRSQNVLLDRADPNHIHPEKPAKQVIHIRWIPLDPRCIELNMPLPPGATPICHWSPQLRSDNGKLGELTIHIGFKVNGAIFRQEYQVKAGILLTFVELE